MSETHLVCYEQNLSEMLKELQSWTIELMQKERNSNVQSEGAEIKDEVEASMASSSLTGDRMRLGGLTAPHPLGPYTNHMWEILNKINVVLPSLALGSAPVGNARSWSGKSSGSILSP